MKYRNKTNGDIAVFAETLDIYTIEGKPGFRIPASLFVGNPTWEELPLRDSLVVATTPNGIFAVRRLSDDNIFEVNEYITTKHTTKKLKILKFSYNTTIETTEVYCEDGHEFNLNELITQSIPSKIFLKLWA